MNARARAGVLVLLCAAGAALGCSDGNITTGNTPPSVTLLQPGDGAAFASPSSIELVGVVGDGGTPVADLRVSWTSSLAGQLFDGAPLDNEGTTRFTWAQPPTGVHAITLAVIDPGGMSASASIQIEVTGNQAPTCSITAPHSGMVDGSGPVTLEGVVADAEDTHTGLTIRWSSDIDGVLDESPAGTGGIVLANPTLSPGAHLITLGVSDTGGLTCGSSMPLEVNLPPAPPEIELSPASPTTLDDLTVLFTAAAEDPEGTEVSYEITWSVDGAVVPALVGTSVLASDLDKGEVWMVSVVARDEDGLAPAAVQASATVVNSAPSAPTVAITPSGPTQAQDLGCAVVLDGTDPDGDTVSYTHLWQLGGVGTGFVDATLSWEETEPGDLWTCVVTPTDGASSGPTASATAPVSAGCASLAVEPVNGGQVLVPDAGPLRLASGDFTVEAWILLDAAPDAARTVVGKASGQSGWWFGLTAAGALRFESGASAITGAATVPVGAWTHVAATFGSGSGSATLWIDGANAGAASLPAPTAVTADLAIGEASGLPFDGLIDDVRLSSGVLYAAPFVPSSQLGALPSTLAWWGFEEASGAIAKDLSSHGHDGALGGAAAFEGADSTCANDQAPTAPTVDVTPAYPLITDDLSCALATPAVDPEGATVSYSGRWLRGGVPTGAAFASFPAVLPAASTGMGELWTCRVTASDGGQSGPPGQDTVATGSMLVGQLVVTDPTSPAITSVPFTAPVAGLIRATVSNPDASRDGVFSIDTLGRGVTWLFTGYRDWAYAGDVVAGWASTDVEFNLAPTAGPVTFEVEYDATPGQDNAGVDTLTLEFVYGSQLTTAGASLIASSSVGPQETTLAQATVTFPTARRLLIQTVACGFGGGGHGIYMDSDSQPQNDGLGRVDTGFTGDCLIPLESRPIGAGTWNVTLANEDDFFSDNTGTRGVSLYHYTP